MMCSFLIQAIKNKNINWVLTTTVVNFMLHKQLLKSTTCIKKKKKGIKIKQATRQNTDTDLKRNRESI